MVTLNNEKKGVMLNLSNDGVNCVLDALLHEIERYNKAIDLCTDARVQKACKDAKTDILAVHHMFCKLLDE